MSHLNKHISCPWVVFNNKARSKRNFLVFAIEHALSVLDHTRQDGPSTSAPLLSYLECGLETQTMLMVWALLVKAEKPAWWNLTEIVFLIHILLKKFNGLTLQRYKIFVEFASFLPEKYKKNIANITKTIFIAIEDLIVIIYNILIINALEHI